MWFLCRGYKCSALEFVSVTSSLNMETVGVFIEGQEFSSRTMYELHYNISFMFAHMIACLLIMQDAHTHSIPAAVSVVGIVPHLVHIHHIVHVKVRVSQSLCVESPISDKINVKFGGQSPW